ncbi:MAG TPA: hypothetical protein VLG67_02805 [Candidatus Saccharimonadales bacterium]|nr:hypothetical protein [Candidatus Saccharimonadales bacterium]
MSEGGGGGFDNFKIPGNTESGFDPVADDKKFEIESKEKDKSLIQRLLRKADEDSEKLGFFERHKVKRVEKKAAKAERRAEKKERNALKTYFPATEAEELLKSADEQTQASEAEKITQEANRNPLLTEAAQQVEKESRKSDETEPFNRSPEPYELPERQTYNLENVVEQVMKRWGKNSEEIKRNLENAKEKDVYASVKLLIDAEVLDKRLRDEEMENLPQTDQLKAQVDEAYKALVDVDDLNTRIDGETGRRMVDVTPGQMDGKPTATAGRKPGEVYYTFDTTRVGNAKMFMGIFQNDIRCLINAGKAAESQATGNPLDITYMENPDESAEVAPLNYYLKTMRDDFENAKKLLTDKEKATALNHTEEELSEGKNQADSLFTFFDSIYSMEPKWGNNPKMTTDLPIAATV